MTDHVAGTDENKPTVEDFIKWVKATMADMESVDRSANMHWCSRWRGHPEAIHRLKALYEEWLVRLADGGMSSWWVHHFDAHAKVLFARNGPFGECSTSYTKRGMRRTLTCELPLPGRGNHIGSEEAEVFLPEDPGLPFTQPGRRGDS